MNLRVETIRDNQIYPARNQVSGDVECSGGFIIDGSVPEYDAMKASYEPRIVVLEMALSKHECIMLGEIRKILVWRFWIG